MVVLRNPGPSTPISCYPDEGNVGVKEAGMTGQAALRFGNLKIKHTITRLFTNF